MDAESGNGLDDLMDECRQGRLALKETIQAQKAEIDRLRDLVAGYEGGRLIRFLQWLNRLWPRSEPLPEVQDLNSYD